MKPDMNPSPGIPHLAVLQPTVIGLLMLSRQPTTQVILPEHGRQLADSFITAAHAVRTSHDSAHATKVWQTACRLIDYSCTWSSIIVVRDCIKAVLTAGVGTKGVGGGGTGW